jgi:hypothetical protein
LDAFRAQDVRVESASGGPLQSIDPLLRGLPVDLERALPCVGDGQHQLLPLRIGRELCDLDGDGSDGPCVALAPPGNRSVRRGDVLFERGRGALGRLAAPLEDDDVFGRANERAFVPGDIASRCRDGIPFAGARDARDARLDPAERPRIAQIVVQVTLGSMSP